MREYWSPFDYVGWDVNEPKVTALHPKVVDALSMGLGEAKARGFSVAMFCGLRTAEEQQKLYDRLTDGKDNDGDGKIDEPDEQVSKAKAWESWHNYGLAVDIVFKDANGKWTWNKTDAEWAELAKCFTIFGFTWGGTWKFKDNPHFQMTGKLKNVHEAKKIAFEQGLDALWKLI